MRLIDDFSESAINQTVSVHETLVLHTVEVACAAVSFWFSCCEGAGQDPSLVSRTFDLSSAYRQVAVSKAGRSNSNAYIRVYHPAKKEWAVFQAQVIIAIWSYQEQSFVSSTCSCYLVVGRSGLRPFLVFFLR